MEIFHYLDHGENPERFVKDSLEQCFTKNQQTHAKVFTLDALRDQLANDFSKEFPEQYKSFMEQSGPQCPIKPINQGSTSSQMPQQQAQQPAKTEVMDDSDDEAIEVVPTQGNTKSAAPAAAAAAAHNTSSSQASAVSVGDDEGEDEVVSIIKRSRSTNMVDVVPDDDSMQ